MRALIAFTALLLAGCVSAPNSTSIHHAVFFTLNDPKDAAELTADCGQLRRIPGADGVAVGKPVPTGRATVDSAYDVGLYVKFGSAAAYQAYLDHPIHTQLVSKWKPRWKSIQIRDFGRAE